MGFRSAPLRSRWLGWPWIVGVTASLAGGPLIWAVYQTLTSAGFQGRAVLLGTTASFALTMLVALPCLAVAYRRRHEILRCGGVICLKCGFDRRGLELADRCPECGASYKGRHRA